MICATKCALCGEVLDQYLPYLGVERTMAAHAVGCPKRPLAEGDYVRHDGNGWWAAGAVKNPRWACRDGRLLVETVLEDGISIRKGERMCFSPDEVRRIPRPEAQANALVETASGALAVRTAHGDIKITADPTLKPGEFRIEQPRFMQHIQILGQIPSAQHRLKLIKGSTTVLVPLTEGKHSIGDVTAGVWHLDRQVVVAVQSSVQDWYWIVASEDARVERITWLQTGGTKSVTFADPAIVCRRLTIRVSHADTPVGTLAPALVDGIDRETCLARWMENRLAVETRCPPPNTMTRMQRDVARTMWLQRYGVAQSAELRGMVDADREAERCRVRVELEVEPWE